MANFLARRIINNKLEFKDVPDTLKDDVSKILILEGYEHLVG